MEDLHKTVDLETIEESETVNVDFSDKKVETHICCWSKVAWRKHIFILVSSTLTLHNKEEKLQKPSKCCYDLEKR